VACESTDNGIYYQQIGRIATQQVGLAENR